MRHTLRPLDLMVVDLVLGVIFLLGAATRFESPSYAVPRHMWHWAGLDGVEPIRVWGVLFLIAAAALALQHPTGRVRWCRWGAAIGLGVAVVFAAAFALSAIGDDRAGLVAPVVMTFIALQHWHAGGPAQPAAPPSTG